VVEEKVEVVEQEIGKEAGKVSEDSREKVEETAEEAADKVFDEGADVVSEEAPGNAMRQDKESLYNNNARLFSQRSRQIKMKKRRTGYPSWWRLSRVFRLKYSIQSIINLLLKRAERRSI